MSNEKIKMTKEMKAQLSGLIPMNNDAKFTFTPSVFDGVDEEYRPVFEIKQFNNEQVLRIKTMISKEFKTTKRAIKMEDLDAKNKEYMAMVHTILVGWSGLYTIVGDSEMIELPYEDNFETFMSLPETIRTDIFAEAMKLTGFIPQG